MKNFTFVNVLGGTHVLLSETVLSPLDLHDQLDWFEVNPSFPEGIVPCDHGVAENHLA
jgi:hypothetical protein